MTPNDFELTLGEVSPMEARVLACFRGEENVTLKGTLRGPYCETARTLPAEFPFHKTKARNRPTAEAVVPDPCLWSPELPHIYRAEVEAHCDGKLIAEYHGEIGLKSTTPIRVHE
jgi:beta-galactosidase/beta-glucuronidase